jgi:hypothetical protein
VPIERLYLEALAHVGLDPDVALARFQAIIDLYGSEGDRSGPTAQCVELARRRVAEIRERLDVEAQEHLNSILDRLAEADRVRPRDPARAAAVYRAVVELYAGKPWAAAAVRRAQQGLAAGAPAKKNAADGQK